MLKKIIWGAALLASTSFATYSNFPVPAVHSGEARLVADFVTQDKWKELDLAVKGSFVPVQNLELFLNLPFAVITRWDGEDVDQERMMNLTFGARYQLIPTVAGFLDVTFPTGKKVHDGDNIDFYFGAQYSQDFGAVALGTEVGLSISTEGKDKRKPPMELSLNAELDPNVSPIISPYFGVFLKILLSDPKFDGHKESNTSGDVGVFPYLGATYKINETLSFDFNATFGLGKAYLRDTCDGNDKVSITLEAGIVANF